jgi:hypothetical protein
MSDVPIRFSKNLRKRMLARSAALSLSLSLSLAFSLSRLLSLSPSLSLAFSLSLRVLMARAAVRSSPPWATSACCRASSSPTLLPR